MKYYKEQEEPLVLLKEWIDIYFSDDKQQTLRIGAYVLKHYFQYYPGGIYLTEEEFIELMKKTGFEPHYGEYRKVGLPPYRKYRPCYFCMPQQQVRKLEMERFRYGFTKSVWYYRHAKENEKEKVKRWIQEYLEPVKTHNDVLGDLVWLYKEFCNIDKSIKIERGFMRGALLELGYSETLGVEDFKINVSKRSINKLHDKWWRHRVTNGGDKK